MIGQVAKAGCPISDVTSVQSQPVTQSNVTILSSPTPGMPGVLPGNVLTGQHQKSVSLAAASMSGSATMAAPIVGTSANMNGASVQQVRLDLCCWYFAIYHVGVILVVKSKLVLYLASLCALFSANHTKNDSVSLVSATVPIFPEFQTNIQYAEFSIPCVTLPIFLNICCKVVYSWLDLVVLKLKDGF